jgi:alkylation response protein AidB-like acyl-CoA dehydrogenase
MTPPVALGWADRAPLDDDPVLVAVPDDPRDLTRALRFAADQGGAFPLPRHGATRRRWELLATVAAVDVQLARVVEPHVDALAILAEADRTDLAPAGSTWGVWAAEGPGGRLSATATRTGWALRGPKPWCSLAGQVSHALVTAWLDDTRRGLFAVDLDHDGVGFDPAPWVSRGLPDVRSAGVRLDDVPAVAVGGPDWYLERAGFAHGGIGVAAVWFGGAVGVARRLARPSRRPLDQVAQLHRGEVDATLHAARAVLAESAALIDGDHAYGTEGRRLAARVRLVVARAAEEVLARADRALGPAPLTAEEDHAARVADLRVYLRQHHGERDAAALGALLGDRIGEVW